MHIIFVHDQPQMLGIEYLSSVMKEIGHTVDVILDTSATGYFDLTLLGKIFRYREKLIQKILQGKPDLIAFSASSNNIDWAYGVAKEIKQSVDTPVVFGGIQATLIPEVVISKEFIDFVVVGEGEIALPLLVKALKEGGSFDSINNLWFKKNGIAQANPLGAPVMDLDRIPFPDKELLKINIYRNSFYPIITGRGCIGNCTYCCASFVRKMYAGNGNFLRRRSPENVIEELILAKKKYNINRVVFEDDLFTYDKQWLAAFSEAYREKINLPCLLCAHPNYLDAEVVGFLKKIDCRMVEVGVQSVNEEIRKNTLHRYYTNENLAQAFKRLNENGIVCQADNIIGLPGETQEDFVKMLKFYNEIRPGKIDVYFLKYFPKLEIINKSDMAPSRVEEINKGLIPLTHVTMGDGSSRNFKEVNKLILMVSFLYFFPKKVVDYILRKNMYTWLPSIRSCHYINEAAFYLASIFNKNWRRVFPAL
ncbi:MAG: radical SAM protein, partial [Candidatus Omnitrophota bacterium]